MGENQPAKTGRCSTPVSLTCKQWAAKQEGLAKSVKPLGKSNNGIGYEKKDAED